MARADVGSGSSIRCDVHDDETGLATGPRGDHDWLTMLLARYQMNGRIRKERDASEGALGSTDARSKKKIEEEDDKETLQEIQTITRLFSLKMEWMDWMEASPARKEPNLEPWKGGWIHDGDGWMDSRGNQVCAQRNCGGTSVWALDSRCSQVSDWYRRTPASYMYSSGRAASTAGATDRASAWVVPSLRARNARD